MKTIQKILVSLALAATVLVGSISPASAAEIDYEPAPAGEEIPEPPPAGCGDVTNTIETIEIKLPPIVVDPASKGGAIVVTGEKK